MDPQLKRIRHRPSNVKNALKSAWCFNTSLLLGVTPNTEITESRSVFPQHVKDSSKLGLKSYILRYSLCWEQVWADHVMHWLINGKSASGHWAKIMRKIIRPRDVGTLSYYISSSAAFCRRASTVCCRSWWPSLAPMMSTCWLVQLASSPTSPAITRATR